MSFTLTHLLTCSYENIFVFAAAANTAKSIAPVGCNVKDMFNVPAQVLIEFGLQFAQLLLCLPHVLLQLKARLPGVVVAPCQRPPVAHLVTCRANKHTLVRFFLSLKVHQCPAFCLSN